jgi:hypothetical protein
MERIMINNKECGCIELEKVSEIKGFNSIFEFERFQKYLDKLIQEKKLIQVSYIREKWFWEKKLRCAMCNKVWILTEPDFPFKGYWGKANYI